MKEQITIKIWTDEIKFGNEQTAQVVRLMREFANQIESYGRPATGIGTIHNFKKNTSAQVVVAIVHDEAGEP